MADFINCPKCGTRNFKDDKVCGICGTELNTNPSEDDGKSASIPWTGLVVVGLIAAVIFILVKANQKQDNPQKKEGPVEMVTSTSPPEDNSPVSYFIEEVQNKPDFCVISVRLQHKISKERLHSLSDEIKYDQNCRQGKYVIFYILPETKKGNGAWARVDYNPSFSLEYLAPSLEEEIYARDHKSKFKIIGAWVDNNSGQQGMAQRIRYNSEGKLVMEDYEISDPDRESIGTELKKIIKNGKIIFKVVDSDTGDYYVLQPNGDLAGYDNQGLVVVLKKL